MTVQNSFNIGLPTQTVDAYSVLVCVPGETPDQAEPITESA